MDHCNAPFFLTVDDVHKLIGRSTISRRAMYKALDDTNLPNVRIGRRRLVPRHLFLEWLKQCGAIEPGRAIADATLPALTEASK